MTQTAIPFLFIRGGTSRGPYFNRTDLPENLDKLSEVLIAICGSGHPQNIDGIGGGHPVTTKVAMLSRATDDWAEIDYFFAQVNPTEHLVDFKPTCGNILSGVGQAAVEFGLIKPEGNRATVNINAVNTGAKVTSEFELADGKPVYHGDTVVDGVPGTHAPVTLKFMDVAGSSLGAFLPTGNLIDKIDGIEVTCLDIAMPMVLARAEDFGKDCTESRDELDADKAFYEKMEPIRLKAAELMGMGDCSKSVTPKFGLLAPASKGGDIAVRYFMPWSAHPTLAVTGGQCMAACSLMEGTIADGMMARAASPATLMIEQPLGMIEIVTEYENTEEGFKHISGGLKRTARLLARGEVMVPTDIWDGSK